MTDETIEIVRGSGNVFRDFGHPDADREQLRAILAGRIIGMLDDRGLSIREAHALSNKEILLAALDAYLSAAGGKGRGVAFGGRGARVDCRVRSNRRRRRYALHLQTCLTISTPVQTRRAGINVVSRCYCC